MNKKQSSVVATSPQKARRDNGTGSIFKPKNSRFYWLKYYVRGQMIRQSSKQETKRGAGKVLWSLLAEVDAGTWKPQRMVTVSELFEDHVTRCTVEQLHSLKATEYRIKSRLNPFFGHMEARNLSSTDRLDQYVLKYRKDGFADGTITLDLACFKQAYLLAIKRKKLQAQFLPDFPRLAESKPREGVITQQDFDRLLAQAGHTLWLRAFLLTAYTLAFRRGELEGLRVGQVDLVERVIKLKAGCTKNGKARVVPMGDAVFHLLQACCAGKAANDPVFTRNGKPVGGFRKTWRALCCAAGLAERYCPACSCEADGVIVAVDEKGRCPECLKKFNRNEQGYKGPLVHDLRRSAVTNMIRRGIGEKTEMQISGHLTRDVFDRYTIASLYDTQEAVRKIEAGAESSRVGLILGHSETAKTPSN